MIKTKLALAVAIVLGSSLAAVAQAPYYNNYYGAGRGSPRSYGAPPTFSDNPRATGGGSAGYNDNVRRDDW